MSKVSDALTTLATNLTKDELAQVLPVADSYLESIVNSKSLANDAAQSVSVEVQLQALLPNLETTAITDTATALKSLMDLEAAAIPAAVAADLAAADPVADAPPAAS